MWQSFIDYVAKDFTARLGITGVIIVVLCWLIHFLAKKLLESKDKQIALLSEENKKYKETFMEMLDKQFSFDKDKELSKK